MTTPPTAVHPGVLSTSFLFSSLWITTGGKGSRLIVDRLLGDHNFPTRKEGGGCTKAYDNKGPLLFPCIEQRVGGVGREGWWGDGGSTGLVDHRSGTFVETRDRSLLFSVGEKDEGRVRTKVGDGSPRRRERNGPNH